jgi:putative copper resistance protein D
VHGSQQRASQAAPGAAALKEMEAHAGYSMNPATSDPHPWCDGAVWSTFNHRVAGCYLALWGFAALIAGLQGPPGTWWRFAPSVVLLGLVQFLFFRNDPEAWPVGPLSFWDSLQGEDLQHRVFLLLLLAIAVVELLRAGSRLPEFFAKYSVAILAGLGGVYLFFHNHGGEDMSRATTEASMQQMMASMNTVLHEHMWFSVLGFGVAGSRLLGDARILKGQWGACLWTVFAITLGVYMTYYVE